MQLNNNLTGRIPLRRISLTLSIIVLATAPLLYLMGRVWWCKCNQLTPWNFIDKSMHSSQHLFDWYTPTHILHGVVFFWILHLLLPKINNNTRLTMALLIEAAWELAENSTFIIQRYRSVTIAYDYFGDSVLNSCADIFSCLIGYIFASRFGALASIALFLIFEIFCLYFIKDNLTLNVIMLTFPLDFIKEWQLGK